MIAIGEKAFYSCFRLEDVYIPNSVVSIGDGAFEYTSLKSVYIPMSVEYIGKDVFYGCSDLSDIRVSDYNKRYESIEGILIDKNGELIRYPSAKEGAIYTIPKSVRSIASGAFQGCSNITYLEITDDVYSIGHSAFRNCTNLRNIYVSKNNKSYKSVDGVLFDESGEILIRYPSCKVETEYVIPDTVSTIGVSSFEDSINISEITIPDSVAILGDGCFAGCSNLESISIPDSVVSIGLEAFFGCTSLKRIFIPYSVEKIGATAFSFCSDLQEICIDRERDSIYGAPWSEIDIEVRWRGDF